MVEVLVAQWKEHWGILDERLFKWVNMKKIAGVLLLLMITSIPSTLGAYSGNSTTPTDNNTYFTRIYVDGANADSSGYKLLLRASERHAETHFQP
ncbi:MAG: hypothetical protein O8C63_02480 [Candidatus Methanoperedens sp.]|nr:hypothetical protein [Candidatus Methanoperedens sp.]